MARRCVGGKQIHLRARVVKRHHGKIEWKDEEILTTESFNDACIKMYSKFMNDDEATLLEIFRVMKTGHSKLLLMHKKIPVKRLIEI